MAPELAATRLAGHAESTRLLIVGPSLGTAVVPLWTECAQALADVVSDFEVVGWDIPGHGSSPASARFTAIDIADAVKSMAKAIAGGRSVHYAGVSFGGAVGLEIALSPGIFMDVVALAAAPKFGEPGVWRERAAKVRAASTSVMVGPSSERWFAPGFSDRAPATVGALLTSLADADANSYAVACEALANLDLSDRLTDVKVPLLLAAGERDVVVPPHEVRSWNTAPNISVTTVPDCGHLPPAEQPEATAHLLCTFFEEDR